MSIYIDKITKVEGKEIARAKFLELANLTCGVRERKKQALDMVKGILGLKEDFNSIPIPT